MLQRRIHTMASFLFVADFDMTITQKDTSYLAFKAKDKYVNAPKLEKNKYLDKWNQEGKNYYENYVKAIDNALLSFPSCIQFDSHSLKEFSIKVDHFNLQSRQNLAEKKVFDDVKLDTGIAALAEEVIFCPSSMDILREFNEDPSCVTKVLSVNWFPELLKHVLKESVKPENIVTASIPKLSKHKVNSSFWPYIDFGPCSSAIDKHQWIVKWMNENKLPLVYVGDSTTDLLALTEATYGVLFGNSSNTFRVAKHFGISLKPLSAFSECVNPSGKILYTTCSWDEIGVFIDQLKKRLGLF